MTPVVTAAVLLAAVTHAGWNAIAHRITDKLVGFTLLSGGGALIGFAAMPFVPVPAAGAWPYLGRALSTSCVRGRGGALWKQRFRR